VTTIEAVLVPEGIKQFVDGAERSILIDGQRQSSSSGECLDNYDPGTGQVVGRLARGKSEDIDRAVRSAQRAFDAGWRDLKPGARARCLLTLADLIDANVEELATLETLDNGKPITESMYIDLAVTAEVYRYYGGWTTKFAGGVLPVSPVVGSAFAYTRQEPLGVVGAIVPWNFPALILSWKLGPALAAGNTVVVKPSELTSLSTLRVAELALEAGIPPGVVNVVTGLGAEAGQALAEHDGVAKVSFTGSTATGRKILAASVDSLKQVTLELGGKSPNIIFADADLDVAVQGALLGIFMNQGQVCCAGSRAFVEAPIYDAFLDRISSAAAGIHLGHGLAEGSDMGPLVSAVQQRRVLDFIDSGTSEGATLVCGGGAPEGDGYFVSPTIFTDVDDKMTIAREEIFGPVLSVLPFKGEEEVITRANASRYGLAAGVWTQNLRRAHTVAAALEAGTVWINAYNMIDPTMPFGGYKESGFGRDLGADAMRAYTNTKSVWVGLD
jgi:aldehyde dehydrogenase (NAD+)/phenylacetaldehyde dehydrogenase